jgi:hypothetical protein
MDSGFQAAIASRAITPGASSMISEALEILIVDNAYLLFLDEPCLLA